MTFLAVLWIPILLSAVFVFIASSVIHMATPMHKGDYKKLANEAGLLDSMRAHGVEPGTYMFPCAGSMKEMGSPEMIEKMKRGPVGWMTILPPGGANMGKCLGQWFLYSIVVGVFAAYVGWHALGAGAPYLSVFRIVGAVTFMTYALDHMTESIWKGLSWGTNFRFMVDDRHIRARDRGHLWLALAAGRILNRLMPARCVSRCA